MRLDMPREPYWLDLPGQVRVKVRPLTTAVHRAAQMEAVRQVERLRDHEELARQAGLAGGQDDETGLSQEALIEGYTWLFTAKALGRAGILDWSGIFDADGETALSVSPPAIDRLMEVPTMADAFVLAYSRPLLDLATEGNA